MGYVIIDNTFRQHDIKGHLHSHRLQLLSVVREFIALHWILEDLLFMYGSGGGPDIYNNFGQAPAGQVA